MTSNISRRGFLGTSAGAAALSVAGLRAASAQKFPERGILVIVPYAAGGGSDVSARLLARDLEPIMGKSVIGLCATFGMAVGGYVPVLWGASSFSLVSLVFGFAGGVAGVWLGVRVSDV